MAFDPVHDPAPLAFWLRLAIELMVLCFNAVILAFVFRQIQRRVFFYDTGFFKLFVITTTADIFTFLLIALALRLYRFGYIPSQLMVPPVPAILMFILNYANYLQYCAHAAIALNRYMAFAHPMMYQRTWNEKQFRYIAIVVVVLPIFGASTRLMDLDVNLIVFVEPGSGSPVHFLWPFDTLSFKLGAITSVIYGVVSSIVSVCLELRTIVIYRRLSRADRVRHRDDFFLLIYACATFLGQLFMTFFNFSAVVPIGSWFSLAAMQDVHTYAVDVLCLTGPPCLLITSRKLRQDIARLWGLAGLLTRYSPVEPQSKLFTFT